MKWQQRNQLQKGGSHVVSLVITALSIAIALFLLLNRQYVLDQLAVWQYTPSGEIAQFAEKSGMNKQGEFYFYAAHPRVEDAATFNRVCDKHETTTAILGCYNGRDIFIYNVTDKRLNGIKAVTAAHEMLHVAYVRLSDGEKEKVNKLLEAEYEKLKGDAEFSKRMAFYDRTEPGERMNELHSVIGTEVAQIDPALEEHYKKYFSDRSKSVALHQGYAAVFEQLQEKSDALSKRLSNLADEINRATEAYNADVSALNADVEAFNQKARGGGFTSDDDFRNERAELLDRAATLNATREDINGLIAEYNNVRVELESVASQSQALNQSINSSLAPAPSL